MQKLPQQRSADINCMNTAKRISRKPTADSNTIYLDQTTSEASINCKHMQLVMKLTFFLSIIPAVDMCGDGLDDLYVLDWAQQTIDRL